MGTTRTTEGTSAFHHKTEEFIESMDGLCWLAHLDEDHMDSMLKDLAEVLANSKGAECRSQMACTLWAWKATAEVLAHPQLHRQLSEPIAAVSGEPVPTPSA